MKKMPTLGKESLFDLYFHITAHHGRNLDRNSNSIEIWRQELMQRPLRNELANVRELQGHELNESLLSLEK